jgi:hypothetical protein
MGLACRHDALESNPCRDVARISTKPKRPPRSSTPANRFRTGVLALTLGLLRGASGGLQRRGRGRGVPPAVRTVTATGEPATHLVRREGTAALARLTRDLPDLVTVEQLRGLPAKP